MWQSQQEFKDNIINITNISNKKKLALGKA
jgi:hypothetical protein